MDLFQGLQSLLGDGLSGMTNNKAVGGSGGDGLSGLLNPNVLGGLVNALLSSKGGGAAGGMGSMGAANGVGGLLGALMSGGGASLLGQQSAQVQNAYADAPQYGGRTAAAPQDRAARIIRALVYAAKADGHIDQQEQASINDQLRKLNVGPEGQALVQKAMDEPLDPNLIASGVQDGQEAMQLYVLSYALTGTDQFMERSYLDGLAKALRIPADAKAAIEAKMRGGR